MEQKNYDAIIEAMLFATGRTITEKEIMNILELGSDQIAEVMTKLKIKYEAANSGLELVKINDGYQLCSKKEFHEYVYPLIDNRVKPSISNAALETLSIIAYNSKITRAEIEAIRGVGSDGTIYKLLEYNLIEEAGRLDAPGRPTMYKVTDNFLKMFGLTSLEELPELPRYKLDENEQIVIDDIMPSPAEGVESNNKENVDNENEEK